MTTDFRDKAPQDYIREHQESNGPWEVPLQEKYDSLRKDYKDLCRQYEKTRTALWLIYELLAEEKNDEAFRIVSQTLDMEGK